MSDSDTQNGHVLGKRSRQAENDNNGAVDGVAEKQLKIEEEESDDDLGPMPLPASENEGGTKKRKRKGMVLLVLGAVEPSKSITKNPPAFSVSSSAS